MDIATILGLILGVVVMVTSVWIGGSSFSVFFDFSSILCVFGGVLCAVLIGFPMKAVADGRSAQFELDVVPGRVRPVDLGHGRGERVAAVLGVVVAAPAQVDAADEGDVEVGAAGVAYDEEFLVVRAAEADPHVEHHVRAGGLQVLGELAVLWRAEVQPVRV